MYVIQDSKPKSVKPADSEVLFDEVFKKSLVYSQKYNTGSNKVKPQEQQIKLTLAPEKRANLSARSDLSVRIAL